ncbi:hypothetical protein [Myxosarcina sp. GI1]|uniref:hypothetical protein n=1 Tax=Myxosarcina sp. GI1 TaxID=1541065 RepID=UPI0012E01D89|nr:hypothetical protein [Myxosarcina sp. GI1]
MKCQIAALFYDGVIYVRWLERPRCNTTKLPLTSLIPQNFRAIYTGNNHESISKAIAR